MFWDFITLRPETTHQVCFLFSDRGIPDGYQHMNGYGSHTFKLLSDKGDVVYCKFHVKVQCLSQMQCYLLNQCITAVSVQLCSVLVSLLLLATSVRSCCSGTCRPVHRSSIFSFQGLSCLCLEMLALACLSILEQGPTVSTKTLKSTSKKMYSCTGSEMYLNFSLINGQAQNLWKTKQSILFILL